MENTIAAATSLYQQKKYGDAYLICQNLIKNGVDMKRADRLSMLCVIHVVLDGRDEGDMAALQKLIWAACEDTDSVEEVAQLECDALTAYNDWVRDTTQFRLHRMLSYEIKDYDTFTTIMDSYEDFRKSIIQNFRSFVWDQTDRRYTPQDIDQWKVWKTPGNEVTDLELAVMQKEFADQMTSRMNDMVEKCNTWDKNEYNELTEHARNAYFIADSLYDRAMCASQPGGAANNEFNAACLKRWHYLVFSYLHAEVTLGVEKFFLCQTDRDAEVEKYNQLTEEIKKICPDFVETQPGLVGDHNARGETATPQNKADTPGCYVATAVYGSYDCPQVWTLRRYRDNILAKTRRGRAFIRTYYAISPTLVRWFGHTTWFRNLWKPGLDRKVAKLNARGVENTPYQDRSW